MLRLLFKISVKTLSQGFHINQVVIVHSEQLIINHSLTPTSRYRGAGASRKLIIMIQTLLCELPQPSKAVRVPLLLLRLSYLSRVSIQHFHRVLYLKVPNQIEQTLFKSWIFIFDQTSVPVTSPGCFSPPCGCSQCDCSKVVVMMISHWIRIIISYTRYSNL